MPDLNESLGFETEDVNLFELYNKNQKGDAPVAIELDPESVTLKGLAAKAEIKNTEKDPLDSKAKDLTPEEQKKKDEDEANKKATADLIKETLAGKKPADLPTTDKGEPGAEKKEPGKDKEPEGDETPIGLIYASLSEKGILSKVEGFDGSEEALEAAVQATVEERLEAAVGTEIEAAFSKNPAQAAIAKDFISHLGRGGLVADFVESRKATGIDATQLDNKDEAVKTNTAIRILATYYNSLGWEQDRITRAVERSKTKGVDNLVEEAKDVFPEFEKAQASRKRASDEQLIEEQTKTKESIKTFNTSLATSIENNTELLGFDISTPKAKKELNDYLFTPTETMNGKKVPKFMADRATKMNNPDYVLAQALLFKNDLKLNTKALETKAAKTLNQKLTEISAAKTKTTTGTGTDDKGNREKGPSIVDLVDGVMSL